MTRLQSGLASNEKPSLRVRYLRQFGRDEDGGIIVLTLLLLVVMLVMGGMAVDFMRYESRRALLQSVSDRAVLAAAELDLQVDSSEVVIDYFRANGVEDAIIGAPIVNDEPGSRSVRVNSELDISTIYLGFVGIDELSAPAASAAIEGTGNIEISMVLDISGSMGGNVNVPDRGNVEKMVLLQEAASAFVDTLLIPEYQDQVSISLVNYSADVSVGDGIYDALTTTPDTIYEAADGSFTEYTDEELEQMELLDPDFEVALGTPHTNPSRCIEFNDSEFTTRTFDTARTYQQVARFSTTNGSTFRSPRCPEEDFQGIIALTQDGDRLKTAINQLRPTKTTSIHLGMKWGVSLIDPSMRDLLAGVPGVDPAFAGVRPADYTDATSAVDTAKYVILMTDGQNYAGPRMKDSYYADPFWRAAYNQYGINYWRNNINDHPSGSRPGTGNVLMTPHTRFEQDDLMQDICTAARAEGRITVFTIAMGSTTHGETQMKICAEKAANYFETQGGEITAIFATIASQITDLRLNL